jgi:hypothetical protein
VSPDFDEPKLECVISYGPQAASGTAVRTRNSVGCAAGARHLTPTGSSSNSGTRTAAAAGDRCDQEDEMDKAVATQLANIEKRTGKTLDELAWLIAASGLTKHGEIRDMLKRDLGMGHGDANTLVHVTLKSDGQSAAEAAGQSGDEVLAGIYTGPKAALRPVHDALLAGIRGFGEFDVAPKKGYVSLRRKKQFAMIGPATNTQVEVGLNMKDAPATSRLKAVPPGGMCQYKVRVADTKEVDAELLGWVRRAYDSAG